MFAAECSKKISKIEKTRKKEKHLKDKQIIRNEKNTFNIISEKDLVDLLQADSYSGFDKSQWKMFKKRLKKFLLKLTKNNTRNINEALLKKVNCQIQKWISC